MRLFLAIDLPSKAKNALFEQLKSIRQDYPDFNWTDQKNYHITIHFFGDMTKIEKIKKKIDDALFDIQSFYLYARSAGVFIGQKIVLYVSFEREKILEEAAKKMRNKFHLQNDEKFIPHLTIARSKIPSKQQYLHLKKKLSKLSIDFEFPVKKIYLFNSIFSSQKPEYKKIAVFNLGS